VAAAIGVSGSADALPRLLYIGDVSVADTMAGEALLYRLLQYYPAEKLALICGVRPGMPQLAGVTYHHWGPMFPRLLHSRVAEEYVLWRAWRYYELPRAIEQIATLFRPDAILSISHVSGWLAGWQLALQRRIPFHLIAHDDFVYQSRFPAWSTAWAGRRFGDAYRAASGRFCISDTMAELYRERFGVPGVVIYPTHNGKRDNREISPRVGRASATLTFAYGGSINSATDMQQIVAFARVVTARRHRLIAFSPQHVQLAARAADAGVAIETHAPIHSDDLMVRLRADADCLLLPQSMVEADRPWVATAFPSKWADYSTLGLPVMVWAPQGSSSARFVSEHPGCAELVTSSDLSAVESAIARLEGSADYRRSLAETLLALSRDAFGPGAAFDRFRSVLIAANAPVQEIA
jgi:hypothetical protein